MGSPLARKRTSHSHPIQSLFGWLVADGGCWFVLREKYCWLIAGGWFVLREKYCWLVADKPSEQAKKGKKKGKKRPPPHSPSPPVRPAPRLVNHTSENRGHPDRSPPPPTRPG
jgi:hypothetical protein